MGMGSGSLIEIGDGGGDVALGSCLGYVGFSFLNYAITGWNTHPLCN